MNEQALRLLRRDPLRNIVALKFLLGFAGQAEVQIRQRGDNAAVLLLVDNSQSAFDRTTYPSVGRSVIIASDDPEVTRDVLPLVPRGAAMVFKLMNGGDRDVVASVFALHRQTAFLSYTDGSGAAAVETAASIETAGSRIPFELFESQGHGATWLRELLDDDRAFVSVLMQGDVVQSACFAFHIDGPVWEIGGVYTLPHLRGQGLALQVVGAALAELHRRGCRPRYQVAEDNLASVALARSVGLRPYLEVAHYLGVA